MIQVQSNMWRKSNIHIKIEYRVKIEYQAELEYRGLVEQCVRTRNFERPSTPQKKPVQPSNFGKTCFRRFGATQMLTEKKSYVRNLLVLQLSFLFLSGW